MDRARSHVCVCVLGAGGGGGGAPYGATLLCCRPLRAAADSSRAVVSAVSGAACRVAMALKSNVASIYCCDCFNVSYLSVGRQEEFYALKKKK